VAGAYGDDNPLWCAPGYGAATRWEGPVAPPALVGGDTLVGEDEVTEVSPDRRELMKGDPLRGVHAFYSASAREWWGPLPPARRGRRATPRWARAFCSASAREWWAPLPPGRRVRRRNALVGVLDKPSEFAGRAIHEWTGQVFRVEDGPLLSAQYRLMIRAERTKGRERGRNEEGEQAPYGPRENTAD